MTDGDCQSFSPPTHIMSNTVGDYASRRIDKAAPVENAAPRVLLVEDVPDNQAFMLTVLEILEFQATLAATGFEAIEQFSARHYDIILMDCQLPGLDGYETTKQLRQLEASSYRRVPIIAVTAHVMAGDRKKCLDAGMDDYIAKPIRINALQALLAKWLQLAS